MKQAGVLQLIGNFNAGGSERQAVQLTRLLHETGRYRVHVACLDPRGPLRADIERLGLTPILEYPLSGFYRPGAWRQAARFARQLRRLDISVVHAHDFYTNIFGMAAGSIARVPARIASRRESTEFSGLRRRAELASYRLADCVLANSAAVRDKLLKEGVAPAKVSVIYNGLDVDRIALPHPVDRGSAERLLGLAAGQRRRYVTLVANMRKAVKNQSMLLRAARLIVRVIPEAHFILAGEGELREALRQEARDHGVSEHLHFTGRCDALAVLLSISEVGVLTSKAEGFSNVILEYMAAGLPVVVTDVGGAREAVDDGCTGYVVRSDDHEQFAERVIQLLREPEASRRMGERARATVLARFSPARQLFETERLYARLLPALNIDETPSSSSPGD